MAHFESAPASWAALTMFDQYDIDGLKHSSSDGQRVETQIHTINARHGSKYFGLKKGVSAYALVANHVPCNARIIGTHEHEPHFVFDILHHTTTGIPPTPTAPTRRTSSSCSSSATSSRHVTATFTSE